MEGANRVEGAVYGTMFKRQQFANDSTSRLIDGPLKIWHFCQSFEIPFTWNLNLITTQE